MRVRSWETSVALAMPCKIMKKCGSGVFHKNKTKLNLRVFWKLMESMRLRMGKIRYSIIMKIILQEKEMIHYSIIILFINLFLCLKL